ncbi:unnamed protein product, partial [Porites evermanni]
LPDYLPTVSNINGNYERNYLIEQYFHLDLNYSEIISFLPLRHGVCLSLRQLKRILRSRGLRRRKIQSRIDRVVNAVDQELQSSGSCIGYRQMHQRLLSDHGIVIDRDTVRRIVKSLDRHGVELRSRKRFRRRRYLPDVLFFLPEESNTTHYKIAADESDLDVAENICGTRHHPLGCSSLFVCSAELIMEDIDLQLPRNTEEAVYLYLKLLYHIDSL